MIKRTLVRTVLLSMLVVGLMLPQAAVAFSPDTFDPFDDLYTGARPITDIADFIVEPVEIERSMARGTEGDLGDLDPYPACDQDWFGFTLSADDIAAGNTYLIEVDAAASQWLPVLEIYGPYVSLPFHPTNNPAAVDDGFGGFIDGWTDDMDYFGTGCIYSSIGDKWHDDAAVTTFEFSPANDPALAGMYFFRIRPWGEAFSYWGAEGPYTVSMQKGPFTRLWGDNRIDTAVRLSQEQYIDGVKSNPGSEFGTRVVVATGYNFADALSGSALAGAVSSPLLLTNPASLSPETAAELTRLGAQDILILGGDAAVSPAVEAQLNALVSGTVTRLEGADRVATANAVADYINDNVGTFVAFVADKTNFPDALSAAPLAALNNSPILLTDGDVADARMLQTLTDCGIQDVIVLGGTSALSPAVESAIAARVGGAGHVRRISGADRYETSKNFAAWACGLQDHEGNWADPGNFPIFIGTTDSPGAIQPLDPNGIGVASGVNYPDALAGGVFAGHGFAPILLTRPNEMSPWIYDQFGYLAAGQTDFRTDVINTNGRGLERSFLFGGPSAVNDDVYWDLEGAGCYAPTP